jgi:DNA-directed RNA polymerase specialized sigma24 family protein
MRPALLARALALTDDFDDAEDLTQDVFELLLRKPPRGDTPGQLVRRLHVVMRKSVPGSLGRHHRRFQFKNTGGPRWTRTTYLRVISTALCQLS